MNELTTATQPRSGIQMMMDPVGFQQMNEIAKAYAYSTLFPQHLREGPEGTGMANAVLIINMAMRLNEDPLTVAQHIYFVKGKPGFSASYMISKANDFGLFENPIDWDEEGEGDDLKVTAHTVMKATGKRIEYEVTMKMAIDDGWAYHERKNPKGNKKYNTMPKLMLRYRSAVALIRLYCPQVMIGIPPTIEIEDGDAEMRDITPKPKRRARATAAPVIDDTKDDAETVDAAADGAALASQEKADAEAKEAELAAHKKAEQEKADAAKKTQETPHDPETGEVKKNAPDPARFQALFDTIINDLLDADNPADVVDMYQDQIDQMKDAAPDLYKSLMAEIRDAT